MRYDGGCAATQWRRWMKYMFGVNFSSFTVRLKEEARPKLSGSIIQLTPAEESATTRLMGPLSTDSEPALRPRIRPQLTEVMIPPPVSCHSNWIFCNENPKYNNHLNLNKHRSWPPPLLNHKFGQVEALYFRLQKGLSVKDIPAVNLSFWNPEGARPFR